MPKLSIITINFNNSIGLKKTIESVVTQTYSDFEYLVIDGGSTDGSIDAIKNYADKVSYWVSEKDNGIYHAMNKGIAVAKGEYCLFLNSGDLLVDRNVLKNVFNSNSNAEIIYGDMQLQEVDGSIIHRTMPNKIGVMQLYADTLWHPVAFIQRDLFQKYGLYDEQFRIVSDYEFFVRVILSKKVSTKHLPIEIALFDMSGISSVKESHNQLMQERSVVQDKYFNPFMLFLFRIYSKIRS